MIVVIPAYEPGPALLGVVEGLIRERPRLEIIVMDDGSGPRYQAIFDDIRLAGGTVLSRPHNRGKGAALKILFRHLLNVGATGPIVTADADGQHRVDDILRVGDAVLGGDERTMVLGCRGFTGPVPLRSRVGNTASRVLFRLGAGWSVSDTQTGLRGIPHTMLPWLVEQTGDRFEYEQNVLLRLRGAGWRVRELSIATVYEPHNPTSHFRPIVDSLRVLAPLLLFAGSSFAAFLVDTIALVVLVGLTGMLIPSVIAARVISASVNFAMNRTLVFRARSDRRGLWRQGLRYVLLAAVLLASNVVWMSFLTDAGLPLLVAKVITEAILFVTAYQTQRSFVFGPGRVRRDAGAGASAEEEDNSAAQASHNKRIAPLARMEEDGHLAGRVS